MLSGRNNSNRRRATVLVMVVGVLAMLFIVGSTLLVVSRFERQTSELKTLAVERGDDNESLIDFVRKQLRAEVAGWDGVPYNLGWHQPGNAGSGDPSWYISNPAASIQTSPSNFLGEKYATILGSRPVAGPVAQRLLRDGNLFLSSSEPFHTDNGTTNYWTYFAVGYEHLQLYSLFGGTLQLNHVIPGTGWTAAGDADGDGVPDSRAIIRPGSNSYLRIVSNGGMVLLDPLTHPALLAQVIHRNDLQANNITTAAELKDAFDPFSAGFKFAIEPMHDEPRLRRRGLLPDGEDVASLPANDLRRRLPVTLGYSANAPYNSADWSPHWQQVDASRTDGTRTDKDWWEDRMNKLVSGQPAPARTDKTPAAYDANNDNYDRRHLITTVSADNILRPLRDENRLGVMTDGTLSFRDVIAALSGQNAGHSYGSVPELMATAPHWSVQFNNPQARTAFSLRDVLGDWKRDGTYAVDLGAGVPVPASGITRRRIMQLTAYYLAMLQHTTFLGTNEQLDLNLIDHQNWLRQQLEAAAQFAVNTIDFADAGIPTVLGPAPPELTDDPPTRFQWSMPLPPPAPMPIEIDVVGVERHPYITEAYVRTVQKPNPTNNSEWNIYDPTDLTTNDESIYAVELYNPYDVPLDLSHYTLMGVDFATFATNPNEPVWIAPYSYVLVTNKSLTFVLPLPINQAWLLNPLVTVQELPGPGQNVFVRPDFFIAEGSDVALIRKDVLEFGPAPAFAPTLNPSADVIVDVLAPPANVNNPDPIFALSSAVSWARPGKKPLDLYHDDATMPLAGGTCPATSDGIIAGATGAHYVRRPGQLVDGSPLPSGTAAAQDKLIRDYSLQRHKEIPGHPPKHWHFTLSRQILFPFEAAYIHPPAPPCDSYLDDTPTAPQHHNLFMSGYDPVSGGWASGRDWQKRVEDEFNGLVVNTETVGATAGTQTSIPVTSLKAPIASGPVVLGQALPETPHPVAAPYINTWLFSFQPTSGVRVYFDTVTGATDVTITDQNGNPPSNTGLDATTNTSWVDFGQVGGPPAINGIVVTYNATVAPNGFRITRILDANTLDLTNNTGPSVQPLAFPTTGSLLLVSRYAHLHGTSARPASVAVASPAPGMTTLVSSNITLPPGQLQRVDNGHLPLWDPTPAATTLQNREICTDNWDFTGTGGPPPQWQLPQGPLDIPWGQLVYNYFTALPIEELFHYRDLTGFAPATLFNFPQYASVRLVDLDPQRYNLAYGALFPGLPVVEPVPGPGGPLIGPKVRGRININTAPWWVLDGLPLLTWDQVPSTEVNPVWFDPAVAIPKIPFDRFDGVPGSTMPYDQLPGLMIATDTADESSTMQLTLDDHFNWGSRRNPPPLDLSSVSPTLARGMVAYREMRSGFENVTLSAPTTAPGFLSVGQIADVLGRLDRTIDDGSGSPQTAAVLSSYIGSVKTGIRDFGDLYSPPSRPYAHLGYLQLVAPLVRLTDWATVKDHVFTIYLTKQDTKGDSPTWTHTEVTVDRTNCLYTNDLPAIVSETPPINYYNVVNDQ